MKYQWREYSASIQLRDDGMKQYGYVCRNGKRHIRNYKRNVKNGMSLIDLLEARRQEVIVGLNWRLTEI